MSKFDAQFAGRLDGQTVLVTGTKGGIGHETAQGIGNSGATPKEQPWGQWNPTHPARQPGSR